MTTDVVTVNTQTSVEAAAMALCSQGFAVLPVIDEAQRLLGVVTAGTLVRSGFHRRGHLAAELTVADVMDPADPMPPHAEAIDVAARMISTRVHSVPIVNGDRLVGIVTQRDITNLSTNDDRTIAAAIRDRLANAGLLDSHRVTVSNGIVTISGGIDEADGGAMKAADEAVPGEVRLRPQHADESD